MTKVMVIAIITLLTCFSGLVWGQGRNPFGNISPAEVDRLLNDSNYVKQQIGCVLGRGSCDNIGNQLRLAIPEVLLRNCRACSKLQAENARRVVEFIKRNYPQEWSQIQAKFTPLSQKQNFRSLNLSY